MLTWQKDRFQFFNLRFRINLIVSLKHTSKINQNKNFPFPMRYYSKSWVLRDDICDRHKSAPTPGPYILSHFYRVLFKISSLSARQFDNKIFKLPNDRYPRPPGAHERRNHAGGHGADRRRANKPSPGCSLGSRHTTKPRTAGHWARNGCGEVSQVFPEPVGAAARLRTGERGWPPGFPRSRGPARRVRNLRRQGRSLEGGCLPGAAAGGRT